MPPRYLILPAIFAGLSFPALAAVADLLPGQYRVTTVVAGQAAPTIRYECLTGGTEMFSLPEPDEATRCTLTRNSLANGRIDIARTCVGEGGVSSAGAVTGTHSDTGFTMQARMTGGGLGAPLEIRSVGQRVGAVCVAD